MKAIIDAPKCLCCNQCKVAKACPVKAVFRISSDEPAVIDMTLCHGCGLCVDACPAKAVFIKES